MQEVEDNDNFYDNYYVKIWNLNKNQFLNVFIVNASPCMLKPRISEYSVFLLNSNNVLNWHWIIALSTTMCIKIVLLSTTAMSSWFIFIYLNIRFV